jgi:hypothetical protein
MVTDDEYVPVQHKKHQDMAAEGNWAVFIFAHNCLFDALLKEYLETHSNLKVVVV